MYGTEAILSMAPPAYVFVTLLVCPLFYAIPSTLICMDIATAYPVDGGMASWIDITYGDYLGAHHMYWCARSGRARAYSPPQDVDQLHH